MSKFYRDVTVVHNQCIDLIPSISYPNPISWCTVLKIVNGGVDNMRGWVVLRDGEWGTIEWIHLNF